MTLHGYTENGTSDMDGLVLAIVLEDNELYSICGKYSWFCEQGLKMTKLLALFGVSEKEDKMMIRMIESQERIRIRRCHRYSQIFFRPFHELLLCFRKKPLERWIKELHDQVSKMRMEKNTWRKERQDLLLYINNRSAV